MVAALADAHLPLNAVLGDVGVELAAFVAEHLAARPTVVLGRVECPDYDITRQTDRQTDKIFIAFS